MNEVKNTDDAFASASIFNENQNNIFRLQPINRNLIILLKSLERWIGENWSIEVKERWKIGTLEQLNNGMLI